MGTPSAYPPPQIYPPTPARSAARRPGFAFLIGAACAWLIWLLAPHIPFSVSGRSVTVQRAHALCSSGLGQFGQLLSSRVAADCGNVGLAYEGLAVLFWGGLLMAGTGVFLLNRRAARR